MRRKRIYIRAKINHDFKNALKFSLLGSTGHRVSVANSSNFNFGSGDFSISFWACNPATNAGVIEKLTGSLGYGFRFASSGVMSFTMRYSVSSQSNINWSIPVPTANQWGYYTMVRSGGSALANTDSANYKLYVNGTLRAQVTAAQTLPSATFDTTGTMLLGVGGGSTQGIILDELAFFGVAMGADEIQYIYNSGQGNIPPSTLFPFVKAYWRFDSSNGKVLIDYARDYNASLTTSQNGALTNYTDAETANAGQPQAGNTAWVNHISLLPITS